MLINIIKFINVILSEWVRFSVCVQVHVLLGQFLLTYL